MGWWNTITRWYHRRRGTSLSYDEILTYLTDCLPGFTLQSYDRHHLTCRLNEVTIAITSFSYQIGPYHFSDFGSASFIYHHLNFHVERSPSSSRITITFPEWTILIIPGVRVTWDHHGGPYFVLNLMTGTLTVNDQEEPSLVEII